MSNKKYYSPIIGIDEDKCISCHMCISVCPVKFCNDGSQDHIELDNEMCIGCGKCLDACTHDARYYIDDFNRFVHYIEEKEKIIAIVSPAVATVFTDSYKRFNGFLKDIGVSKIFDISFGAELTVKSYSEYIKENGSKFVISQPCPTIVHYIQHYQPKLIKYLAKVDSPMLHIAKMIKNYMSEYKDYKIVAISPCLSKKREFEESGIDILNVTYKSIEKYLEKNEIDISSYEEVNFDSPAAGVGTTFSSPKGLIKTLERYIDDIDENARTIEGPEVIYKYFDDLVKNEKILESKLKLVDCLNCSLGCNGGPGTNNSDKSIEELDSCIQKREELKNKITSEELETNIEKYWDKDLYKRGYIDFSHKSKIKIPTQKELEYIYRRMHKFSKEDFYNCSSCGYNTCEKMAIAIFNNLNKAENCHYYYNGIQLENSLNITRMILNNADQGFLVFDRNFMIIDEYSKECERILHKELANKNIFDILYNENNFDEDDIMYIKRATKKLLEKKLSPKYEKIYLDLLPASLKIRDLNIVISYKLLTHDDEKKMMLIITDISDKLELKERMIYEKNNLKMIIKAIVNNSEFKRNIKELDYFFEKEVKKMIDDCPSPDIALDEAFRMIHTFKGDFAQWFMTNIVDSLECLENRLDKLKNKDFLTKQNIKMVFKNCDYRYNLDKDVEIVKTFMGKEFVRYDDFILVKQDKVKELEDKIETICDEEEKQILLPEIRTLRYRDVKELILNYRDYLYMVAQKFDKMINSFEVIGENNLIDEDKYYYFFKSLINVFRNIIDHGIETPDERVLKGKTRGGNIRCEITEYDTYNIKISISDDGEGIDIEKIKRKAIENNIYKKENIERISEKALQNLVFKDHLSTKQYNNSISGRGIGLAAVKDEVKKINGDISVFSEKDKGTRFDIVIPIHKQNAHQGEMLAKIAEVIEDKTKNFLMNEMGLNFNIKSQDLELIDNIELHELTAIISIAGALKGRVVLSLDNEMANKLVEQFIFDDVSEEEKAELAKDVIAEALNTIIGNSTDRLFKLDVKIKFSPPIFIFGEKSHIKYSAVENFLVKFDTDMGKFNLGFVRIKANET